MILHVRHVRAAGLCIRGLRAWCRTTGVDMRQLCRDGVPVADHPHLASDPLVQRVLAAASAEEQRDA